MTWIRIISLTAAMLSLCGCWQIQSITGKIYNLEPSEKKSSPNPSRPTYSQWHYESLDKCIIIDNALAEFQIPHKVDLWDRIRAGFSLPDDANKRVQKELAWLNRQHNYLERVGKRGEPFMFYILEQVEKRGMPSELALLPIVESAFDPFAYSHGRASGIWQIIPSTGRSLGLKQNWWYDGRRDVVAATDAALNYLEKMNKRFDGDWLLAMAAYNSGAGNVNKAIRYNKKRGRPINFWSLNLPKETQAYVPRLLALKELILRPDIYKTKFHSIPNEAYFTAVNTGSQIDLAYAAELAGMDINEMYRLNPAFNRWATDPEGPHRLLAPVSIAGDFANKLKEIPKEKRISWERYKVKNGDTLSTIAQRMRTTTEQIQIANDLNGTSIRVGQALLVPRASKGEKVYALSSNQRKAKIQARGKGQRIKYTVKSGDSFWTIGKKYKVSTRQIAKWNGMAPGDTLRIGQKLVIWQKNKNTQNAVVRRVAYKVRSGDSLARIANKFNVKLQDILDWNSVNPKKYLRPGQKLTLYVDVTKTSAN